LGTPSTQNAVKSVTPTTKKLATTSVTGVSGSTTASKAAASTSQTTATGAGTSSSTNTDWLKGVSVSNGVLTIGAATMNTQTTT
jgi:exopolysaccharide biosynthesis protein